MSYSTFHLVFIVPAIFILLLVPRPAGSASRKEETVALLGLALVAFLYTSAWDNYLVYRGVWVYGQNRVLGVIGYVPLEEYAFFLLQPVLTGLWYYHLRTRLRPMRKAVSPFLKVAVVGMWLLVMAVGFLLLAHPNDHLLYLGLILAWCGPVLAGMSALGLGHAWADGRAVLPGVLVPTAYLWAADGIAIRAGIWSIADRYSTTVEPFGLPLEEAVFFLVTNVMIVQGLTLFLPKRTSGADERAAFPR